MSDILIKNMKLPKGNDYLHLIIQDSKVHTAISCGHLTTDKLNVAKAIEVKPHGELIDKDAVLDILRTYLQMVPIDAGIANRIYEIVYEAPTVLEANT